MLKNNSKIIVIAALVFMKTRAAGREEFVSQAINQEFLSDVGFTHLCNRGLIMTC